MFTASHSFSRMRATSSGVSNRAHDKAEPVVNVKVCSVELDDVNLGLLCAGSARVGVGCDLGGMSKGASTLEIRRGLLHHDVGEGQRLGTRARSRRGLR